MRRVEGETARRTEVLPEAGKRFPITARSDGFPGNAQRFGFNAGDAEISVLVRMRNVPKNFDTSMLPYVIASALEEAGYEAEVKTTAGAWIQR